MQGKWKIENRFITKPRVALAFVISMLLVLCAMVPVITTENLDVPSIRYVWGFCMILMFYVCFLSRKAKPWEDTIGGFICVIVGPIAVLTLLVFALIAKQVERREKGVKSINQEQGENQYV